MDLKMYNELLSPDKETSFFNLLSRLTYSTGTARIYAEKIFRFIAVLDTNKISMKLISLIRSSAQSDVRVTAISYLRLIIVRCPEWQLWIRIEPDVQKRIKDNLLCLLYNEETRSVLEQLRRAVIELGSILLPESSWPQLHCFVFSAMNSKLPRVQESGLYIFSHLAEHIEWSFLPPLLKLSSTIHCSLTNSSGEDVHDLRYAALFAAFSLIKIVRHSEDRKKVQFLLPGMLVVLQEALTGNQQKLLQRAVIILTHLVTVELKFFCRHLPKIVDLMLQIANWEKAQERLKLDAVNLVVTLAKTPEKEPVMVKHLLEHFLEQFVAILLQMLSDIEDDEAWYTADPNEEENNIKYAEKFSNSLSASLGGDLLVPVVINLLTAHLASSDWKKRHAALFFLKEIAKGCTEVIKENLEQFVNMMVDSLNDNHPRVQGAALIAMRVLLVDLKPDLESQYHEQIFPALLQQAGDTYNHPRIQVEAARSAWNFMHSCSKDILQIYSKDLLHTIVHMMILKENRAVQDEALLILESLACLLEDQLQSVYEDAMVYLKNFLKDAILCADRMFCAKLIKCISIVGTVLGKGHFRNDAKEVMKELMSFKGGTMEADDPATGYLLEVWMKLLKCLGRDFLPYMELVMPPLLQSAQSDSELISLLDMDNSEVKTGKGAGEKLLDEKASACNMLCCYADELKEDFYPWIHQVAPLLLPYLKMKLCKKVKKAAISAMSKLLRSAKLAVEKGIIPDGPEAPCVGVEQLCAKIIPALIEAINEEEDKELRCEMDKSFGDCMQLSKF